LFFLQKEAHAKAPAGKRAKFVHSHPVLKTENQIPGTKD
jgi:hypothetical protein